MSPLGLLTGRRALVTGAGNGIGRATARRLAAEGASVALIDMEEEAVRSAAEEIAAGGGVGYPLHADVRSEDSVERAVLEAERELGGLDIVIANAAVEPTDDDRADRLELAVWQRVIDTNLTGIFLTCKHGLRALLRSDAEDRCLICTVSPTGVRGLAPGQDAYSASKAGVAGLMRVLAADYAPEGIRVNGIMPGFTDTRANAFVFADPGLLESVVSGIPLRRAASPDEVAALMAWVASSEAAYATGGVFVLDGGITAV